MDGTGETVRDKNIRAPEMWSFIAPYIEPGCTVIDIGSGFGDMSRRFLEHGAESVHAVDVDYLMYLETIERNFDWVQKGKLTAQHCDIIDFINVVEHDFDIAICFSMLPYISGWRNVMEWMSEFATTSFVEVQYKGDGPGFEHIENDEDWKFEMLKAWDWCEKIGETDVIIRPAKRSIWRAGNGQRQRFQDIGVH